MNLIFYLYRSSIKVPAYLSINHVLYRQLGLRRSILPFEVEVMHKYAAQIINKEDFPNPPPGLEIWINGGDFIFDKNGTLLYAFKTEKLSRANVAKDMIEFLKKIQ